MFRAGTYYETKVRETINRLEFPNKSDATPEDVDDHPTRTVSTRFILDALDEVQKHIVSSAKARHIRGLERQFEGMTGEFNALLTVDRLLHGRVWRNTLDVCTARGSETGYIRCRYRDSGEHILMENAGRQATSCFPAYTWNDNVISVYPSSDSIRVDYIEIPTELTDISDILQIDHRFDGAIVAYVAAQAFKQLGEVHNHDLYMGIFTRRMRYFSRDFRIGPARKGRLGPIHHDEEFEIE